MRRLAEHALASTDQLIPGVPVSGTVTVSGSTITAVLTASGPGAARTRFTASWPLYGGSALASVTLPGGGSASMPAPEGISF